MLLTTLLRRRAVSFSSRSSHDPPTLLVLLRDSRILCCSDRCLICGNLGGNPREKQIEGGNNRKIKEGEIAHINGIQKLRREIPEHLIKVLSIVCFKIYQSLMSWTARDYLERFLSWGVFRLVVELELPKSEG